MRKLPRGAALLAEVQLAKDDPRAYIKRHAKQLDDRGIDDPVPELARIALLDGLIARRVAVEIDVCEDPEDWLAQLRRIVPPAKRKQLPSHKELDALAPAENDVLLKVVGDRLEASGLCLVELDIAADCYPVAVVAASLADDFVAFSKTTRGRTGVLRGANLKKLKETAERTRQRDATRAEQRARRAAAQGPAWSKLMEEYSSFASAVSCLTFMGTENQKLFVAAAKEAPEMYRKRAQLVVDLLKDPVLPAKKADPLEVLQLLPQLPWDPKRVSPSLKALSLLEARIQRAASPKLEDAFWRACRVFARDRDKARRALPPATLERWRKKAEQQFFAKPNLVVGGALEWLGNAATLDTLLETTKPPRSPDALRSPKQHLVYDLAAVTQRKLTGWPKRSR